MFKFSFKFSTGWGLFRWIFHLSKPQRKKPGGVRPGNHGGQSPLEITLLLKKDSTSARFLADVWQVAGSSLMLIYGHLAAIDYTYIKVWMVFFWFWLVCPSYNREKRYIYIYTHIQIQYILFFYVYVLFQSFSLSWQQTKKQKKTAKLDVSSKPRVKHKPGSSASHRAASPVVSGIFVIFVYMLTSFLRSSWKQQK